MSYYVPLRSKPLTKTTIIRDRLINKTANHELCFFVVLVAVFVEGLLLVWGSSGRLQGFLLITNNCSILADLIRVSHRRRQGIALKKVVN